MKLSFSKPAIWLHRYVGLGVSVFLIMAGLTGSVLTFEEELDAWLNPHLHMAPAPVRGATPKDVLDLADEVKRRVPGAHISHVKLKHHAHQSATIYVTYDPSVQGADDLDNEFFLDRYSGEILGSRKWGDISQGKVNVVPFCYRLHYALALEDWGRLLLGLVALLWTVDCFIGAYLTFPPSTSAHGARAGHRARGSQRWIRAWSRSWLLRTSKLFAFVFTWHRASGLWIWGMLFAFAWSSVALNLSEVYSPVMGAIFESQDVGESFPHLDEPRLGPRISWKEARRLGRHHLREYARQRGFSVYEEASLDYRPTAGLYRYKVRSSRDVSAELPATIVWMDGESGEALGLYLPTGEASGDTITSVLLALHFGDLSFGEGGRVASVAFRVFVCALGVMVAALSFTGVWIWWRKRKLRLRPR